MFFIDQEEARRGLAARSSESGFVFVWRYLTPSNYCKFDDGTYKAKQQAFAIRRDKDGVPKEPSASVFKIKGEDASSEAAARFYLNRMDVEKGFTIRRSTAAGSLGCADIEEIKKDPGLNIEGLFHITPTSNAHPKNGHFLIHWDLSYATDDADPEIFAVKAVLAALCKVYAWSASGSP